VARPARDPAGAREARRRLRPLPRRFFARPTEVVAPELIGKLLVRAAAGVAVRSARIVEVEAYLGPRDLASHARRGPTPRAAIMFGPPGHLYVYLIYGMYHCMNVVCEPDGQAGAVLIRAAEPLLGDQASDPRACAGPGKLCRSMGITLADKGLDLTSAASGLFVATDGAPAPSLARSTRIGVDYAGDWAARPLRFYIPGHPSVSGPRTHR
jgi:DNA-3-methyladenine glycosylase